MCEWVWAHVRTQWCVILCFIFAANPFSIVMIIKSAHVELKSFVTFFFFNCSWWWDIHNWHGGKQITQMFVHVCLCVSFFLCVLPPAQKKEGTFPSFGRRQLSVTTHTHRHTHTHMHKPHIQNYHPPIHINTDTSSFNTNRRSQVPTSKHPNWSDITVSCTHDSDQLKSSGKWSTEISWHCVRSN